MASANDRKERRVRSGGCSQTCTVVIVLLYVFDIRGLALYLFVNGGPVCSAKDQAARASARPHRRDPAAPLLAPWDLERSKVRAANFVLH